MLRIFHIFYVENNTYDLRLCCRNLHIFYVENRRVPSSKYDLVNHSFSEKEWYWMDFEWQKLVAIQNWANCFGNHSDVLPNNLHESIWLGKSSEKNTGQHGRSAIVRWFSQPWSGWLAVQMGWSWAVANHSGNIMVIPGDIWNIWSEFISIYAKIEGNK